MNYGRKAQHAQRRPWQDEEFEEDQVWYDEEPTYEEPRRESVEEIIATNRMVLLSCTIAAMLPPFALFLLFAEKKSRAMRHFALQSVALSACHLLVAAALVLINAVTGGIPYLGFLMNLTLWIVYIAALIVMAVLRIRMMFFAWRGVRFTLPLIGNKLDRFNG